MHSRCLQIALAATAAGVASTAAADPADDFVHSFMAKSHAPGVALAVVRDGKVRKEATYGYANLEWHQPLTRSAPFWLDSLTKLITAVGVMQLTEQGKLSLDDPVTKYLRDAPGEWGAVTIRHLLTHSSGIKDDYWQQYRGSPLLNYSEKEIYDYATKQPLVFKPGERYAYDNEGYYLLGLVIAKASGEPYTKWITEHVLQAAGMTTARMYKAAEIIPQMVSSYQLAKGQVVRNRADIMSDRGEAIAGWGLYASIDDMVAFDAALLSGRLVSRSSLNQMWSNAKLNNGYPSHSGIGFSGVTYPRGHRQAWKGGQAGTVYAVFPDDRVSVILLTNMEGSGWQETYQPAQVASFFDPMIQPVSALQPRSDPEPARTARLQRAMADIASGSTQSPALTPLMKASLSDKDRAQMKQLLNMMSGFTYLGCDKAGPSDPFDAVSYCYYRTHIPPGNLDLEFGLTSRGLLASGSGQIEQ